MAIADSPKYVSVVLRTTEPEEYQVPESGFMVPSSSTPANLTALVNTLLEREESKDRLDFLFFLEGRLLLGSLEDALEAQAESQGSSWGELQVTIDYSLASELPKEQSSHREPDWIRTVLTRHDEARSVCLTGSFDKSIRFYDFEVSSEPVRAFIGHQAVVTCLGWIPGSQSFVSGSNDQSLRFWDLETGECQAVGTGHSSTVQCLVVAGETVVSGDYEGKLAYWSTNPSEAEPLKPAISTKKKTVKKAKITSDEPIIRPKTSLEAHKEGPVTAVLYEPHHGCIISSSYDHFVKRWDLSTQRLVDSWRLGGSVCAMALSPVTGQLAISFPDGAFRLLDARAPSAVSESLPKAAGHAGWVNAMAWSPLSENLLASTGADLRVCLWDRRGLSSGPLKVLSETGQKMLGLDWAVASGICYGGQDSTLHRFQ